jgi:uncharacterized SAM-binding protein YcdF (DUF218 family)
VRPLASCELRGREIDLSAGVCYTAGRLTAYSTAGGIQVFYILSKFLPPFTYPLGLACLLMLVALWLRGRTRWQTLAIVAALASLWLGGNRLVAMSLLRSLEWRHLPGPELRTYSERAEVIVVLGGGTRAMDYPRLSSEVNEAGDRLLYAARLYRRGVAPCILLSGGSARIAGEAGPTDAENMANVLSDIGVPREALVLEATSRNTRENALQAWSILSGQGIERIILVTSASHMPRAESVFHKVGFDVVPAPVDFQVTQLSWAYYTRPNLLIQLYNLIPSASHLEQTTRALKEYVGLVVYGLRGWW